MEIRSISAYEEFAEFITSHPTVEQVAAFRLSDIVEERVRLLLDAEQHQGLTPDERQELDEFIRLEHLMRMAKIRAYEKLSSE